MIRVVDFVFKNKMKKLLLISLSLIMVFSLILPANAQLKAQKVENQNELLMQIIRLLLIILSQKLGIQLPESILKQIATPTTTPSITKPPTSTPSVSLQPTSTPPTICNYNHFYNLIIYGGSEAGVSAAIQARRANPSISVAIIEDTDWLGGQLSAQAVTTYDVWKVNYTMDLTSEINERIENYYARRNWPPGYGRVPEPYVGKMVLENLVREVGGIDVYYQQELVKAEYTQNSVTKIITKDANEKYHCFSGNIFLEASGWGDLLLALPDSYQTPIGDLNPIDDQVGCVQRFTYTMLIKRYPNGVPETISLVNKAVPENNEVPFDFPRQLATTHTDANVNSHSYQGDPFSPFIDIFTGGYRTTPCTTNNCPGPYPRGDLRGSTHEILIQPTKTALNIGPEDYPLNESDFLNKEKRRKTICQAKLKTIQLLWWINNIVPNYWQSNTHPNFPKEWGVETEEGFNTPYNLNKNQCDFRIQNQETARVVNEIQKYMPVEPYLREGVRLKGLQVLTFKDVGGSNIFLPENEERVLKVKFDDQIGFAHEFDFHRCHPREIEHYYSTHFFGIPAKTLISAKYDNLLSAGLNISVDRIINSATRLTFHSILTGEAAGVLSAVSLELNKKPSEVVNYRPYLRYYQSKLIDLGVAPFYFKDVFSPNFGGTPYFKFIQKSTAYNIFAGYPDGTFQPNSNLTRFQAAIIITKLFQDLGYDTSVPNCDPNNLTFQDVPCSASYWKEVEFIYRQGITAGCAPKLFCPNDPLLRAQAVIMFDRVIHKINPSRDASSISYRFQDVNDDLVHHAVNTFLQNGAPMNLLQCSANLFCPLQPASRAFTSMLAVIAYGNPLNVFRPLENIEKPTSSEKSSESSNQKVCLMVLTPARNIKTKECKIFPNSCLPEDWFYDRSCGTRFSL